MTAGDCVYTARWRARFSPTLDLGRHLPHPYSDTTLGKYSIAEQLEDPRDCACRMRRRLLRPHECLNNSGHYLIVAYIAAGLYVKKAGQS